MEEAAILKTVLVALGVHLAAIRATLEITTYMPTYQMVVVLVLVLHTDLAVLVVMLQTTTMVQSQVLGTDLEVGVAGVWPTGMADMARTVISLVLRVPKATLLSNSITLTQLYFDKSWLTKVCCDERNY